MCFFVVSMPPSRTVSEPWRKISWGDNARDLQYVKEYKPGNEDIKHVRILLYGPNGAGKSSFIKSVSSVIRGRVTTPALTSDKSYSGTYETFKIREEEGNPESFCHFVFNDVMDLKDGDGISSDDIKLTLKGHVKEGYQFKPSSPLSDDDPGYNPRPSADDQVHVLVCVLSANSAEIPDSVLKKMADIREAASELGIPQMAIGTYIDLACPETENDLKNVYKSQNLKKKVKDFSAAVGVPENYIFPVKNYSDETDINDDVDTLILNALRQMINLGDDFIYKM
ncbi:interferon-induced protein 44-like [Sander lucioperca]|uniref:interferon-induced protein 44-like n=1 Tax=Sander lucioperca TaxID=283035 RepID=UPI00165363A6|nr:interferon-induced protein 44-like [Sander lucioperca]